MDIQHEIRVIESRAVLAGISIKTLCERAGIDRNTWQSWKRGTMPRLDTWMRVQAVVSDTDSARLPASNTAGG
jgi:hypothetical protein